MIHTLSDRARQLLADRYDRIVETKTDDQAATLMAVDRQTGQAVTIRLFVIDKRLPEAGQKLPEYVSQLIGLTSDYVLRIYNYQEVRADDALGILVVIQEAFNGVVLRDMLPSFHRILQLEGHANREFCFIAVQMAEAMRAIHGAGLVHRAVNPYSFYFDPATRRFKLDGLAWGHAWRSDGTESPHDTFASALPYLSPEQAGRLDHAVDFRANLYSLGVLFYEMLTGEHPFSANDPSGVLYGHTSRKPLPPSATNPAIDGALSSLVLKLLAKHPDDRYQSAAGLLFDLADLTARFEKNSHVTDFVPGRKDASPVFTIPDQTYGRGEEMAFLGKCFERARAGGICAVMISGDPGVGKTEVVRRFGGYVRETGGVFLTGKFVQQQQAIPVPLGAPTTVLNGVANWLLSQSPDSIERWREKILSAVSPNGQILIDMIPELELIIGKQPPLSHLPPMEASLRVAMVMEKFGSLMLEKEHPVAFFWDDMQWADEASLTHGIAFLMARERRYCLVLGTYRDNEVGDDHPLTRYVEKLKEAGIPVETLRLAPLDIHQTSAMVAGVLRQTEAAVAPLADIVFEKTGGNPFFIRQFMSSLQAGGLIRYDLHQGDWAWNTHRIAAVDITDNVARLLSATIDQLPLATRTVLQAAACAGHRIDPLLLARVLRHDRSDIAVHLRTAMKSGLLRSFTDVPAGQQVPDGDPAHAWEFAHDHICQAVYHTIPKDTARGLHWSIGKALLAEDNAGTPEKKIFDIVHQLRRGMPPNLDREERIELARLNLAAGRAAMETVGFETAARYLRHARDLLSDNNWDTHYELNAAIHAGLAKCEFVLGNFDASEHLFGLLLQKAPSLLERVRAYNSMIELHTAAGNIDKALTLGRRALGLLGIHLPHRTNRFKLMMLLLRLRFMWGFRRLSSLMDVPENTDELLNATETLLTNIGLPAYYVDPKLCLWINATGVWLGIQNPKKGVPVQHAPLGLIVLGVFLGSIFGFIQMGRLFAKIGIRMLERQPSGTHRAIAYFASAYFNRHWYQPARKSIDYFKRAYRYAMKSGDISYAGHSVSSMLMVRLFLGDNLDNIYAHHKRYENFIQNTQSPFVIATYTIIQQFYRCLKGYTFSPVSLNEPGYDMDAEFATAADDGNLLLQFFFLLFQLKLFVFYRQWDNAVAVAERIRLKNYLPVGALILTEYYFFSFISANALVAAGTHLEQSLRCRRQAALSLRKMKQWRRLRPDNFEPMLRLMEAEKARLSSRSSKVLQRYRQAVASATAGGFTHLSALACESAGNFLSAHGDKIAARAYLIEARKAYDVWGATAKVRDMEKEYAAIFAAVSERTPSVLERMDYHAVVDTLQAVSQEIVVRNLLTRLMEITMEVTGANRAVFISHKNNQLFVEVERRGDEAGQLLLKAEPLLHQNKKLMDSVVYYAKQTRQLVVINDVNKAPAPFHKIEGNTNPPRSLVCMPMSRKKRLVGILYLENTLTSDVFTDDRIELLKLIASQAAISFENAILYEHGMKNEQDLKQLSENLRNLYAELMLTEERERRRIASELHDRIGHSLAGAKIGLEVIAQGSDADQRQRLTDIIQLIDQSITDTRTLTFELSPPILYHLGLGAALDWLCEETQKKHGLKVIFTDTVQGTVIDQKTEVLCFQILRELLFNAVKHARADRISLTLRSEKDRLHLTIQDDGIGFDNARRREGDMKPDSGFGLFSINERLRLVDGKMEIDTGENRGTLIDIIVPLNTGDQRSPGEGGGPTQHRNGS